MLSAKQIKDFWMEQLGTARAFGKNKSQKKKVQKAKEQKTKKYIKKKGLGNKAVDVQRKKRNQLQDAFKLGR